MATEGATINTPAFSKINWAAGIAFIVSLLAIFGLSISPETQEMILKTISLVLPPLIIILRTFFTKKSVT